MQFREFERRARRIFEEIPDAFKEGIDALVVRREAVPHPTLPDVFTLGECLTEEHPSGFGGPDTTRSVIALYWGSFRSLARIDPDFDWEEEIWETLTHELRHHLESLAGADELEEVDYAADELFKREQGEPFDPWYWELGEDLGGGVRHVEGRYYVEQVWSPRDFERADAIELEWRGARYRIRRPEELGDVHFVALAGGPFDEESVELVLVRKRGLADLRRVVGRQPARVLESEAEAEPLGAEPIEGG
ncbi:MAG TPA: hypothetical protein VFQ22_01265 [Longimicrobiales bacterium]|nr:hypothetical protein [Longimicrobiales bacterium]